MFIAQAPRFDHRGDATFNATVTATATARHSGVDLGLGGPGKHDSRGTLPNLEDLSIQKAARRPRTATPEPIHGEPIASQPQP